MKQPNQTIALLIGGFLVSLLMPLQVQAGSGFSIQIGNSHNSYQPRHYSKRQHERRHRYGSTHKNGYPLGFLETRKSPSRHYNSRRSNHYRNGCYPVNRYIYDYYGRRHVITVRECGNQRGHQNRHNRIRYYGW